MKRKYTADELAILEISKIASVNGDMLLAAVKKKYSSEDKFINEWAQSRIKQKETDFYLKCMDLVFGELW